MQHELDAGKAKILFLHWNDHQIALTASRLLKARANLAVEVHSAVVSRAIPLPVMDESAGGDSTKALSAGADSWTAGSLDGMIFDIVVTLCSEALDYVRAPISSTGAGMVTDSRGPLHAGMPILLHWDLERTASTAEGGPWAGRGEPAGAGHAGPGPGIREALEERIGSLVDHGLLEALVVQRRRWGTLLDSLDEAIIAHDNERRIFLFNRAAERMTGLARENVLGRDCHLLFNPDGVCGSFCAFCGPVEDRPSARVKREYEVEFITPAGETRRIRMSVQRMELEPGLPPGVMAIMHDVTEVSDLKRRLDPEGTFHGIVSTSPAMREIFETVRQIGSSDYPVLVSGESGTGKELIANAIHAESRRKGGAFVPINCGALPDSILESELFGHVRGAFTGAIRNKKGRFELANRGTIFLDEVGELSPAFQIKLLRVVQEKRFEMVGGEQTIEVDVRVVSATNRDLRRMVREGTFREDLFYRLCVVPIEIPPLRDRREDVPSLVGHTLERIRADGGRGEASRRVSGEAMDALVRYAWPGNVRELINALQYASVRCPADRIRVQDLPIEIRQAPLKPAPGIVPAAAVEPATGTPTPDGKPRPRGRRPKLDGESVDEAMRRTGGNKVMAARLLGVGRATLYRFLGSSAPTDPGE